MNIDSEYIDGVKVIHFNNGKANTIDEELLSTLIENLPDKDTRGLIITGHNHIFSAGLNLPRLVDYNYQQMSALMRLFHDFQLLLLKAEYPVVAAINGHCIAGGYILALNCDFRIAVEGDYKIGLNEMVRGINLPPIATERIAQLGLFEDHSAMAGITQPPSAAVRAGLIDAVVTEDELRNACQTWTGNWPGDKKHDDNRLLVERLSQPFETLYQPFLDKWFSPSAQRHIRDLARKLTPG